MTHTSFLTKNIAKKQGRNSIGPKWGWGRGVVKKFEILVRIFTVGDRKETFIITSTILAEKQPPD